MAPILTLLVVDALLRVRLWSSAEVSGHLVGSPAFKAGGTGDPRPAGSIPVHLRHQMSPLPGGGVGCRHEEADPARHARRPRRGRGPQGAGLLKVLSLRALPTAGRPARFSLISSPRFSCSRPWRARCSLLAGRPRGAAEPR